MCQPLPRRLIWQQWSANLWPVLGAGGARRWAVGYSIIHLSTVLNIMAGSNRDVWRGNGHSLHLVNEGSVLTEVCALWWERMLKGVETMEKELVKRLLTSVYQNTMGKHGSRERGIGGVLEGGLWTCFSCPVIDIIGWTLANVTGAIALSSFWNCILSNWNDCVWGGGGGQLHNFQMFSLFPPFNMHLILRGILHWSLRTASISWLDHAGFCLGFLLMCLPLPGCLWESSSNTQLSRLISTDPLGLKSTSAMKLSLNPWADSGATGWCPDSASPFPCCSEWLSCYYSLLLPWVSSPRWWASRGLGPYKYIFIPSTYNTMLISC